MMKKLSSVALGVAVAALFYCQAQAQSFGTPPQNPTIEPADAYFKSGRPWYDVRAFGAVGNASGSTGTDDSAAFTAAAAAASATGGVLFVPTGNYCDNSGFSITGTVPVTIMGEGLNTQIQTCGADVNLLTLNNPRHVLRDIVLVGSQVLATTKDTITLQSACVECRIDHVYAVGGRYVLNNAAIDVALSYVNFNQSYGPALIYNGIASGSAQFWGNRLKVDQIWPVSTPARQAAFPARGNTTAYVTGNVVSSGGFYLQATNNGTSGGSPPTLLAYNTNITDGTVTWKLVAPTTFSSIQLDTGSSVVSLHSTDMSGPFTYGLLLSNTLAGTGPQDTIVTDSFFSGILGGVHATAGAGLNVKGSNFSNCITNGCIGILMDTSWAGDTIITDNLMINNPFGVYAANPANLTNLVVSNNTIYGSGSAAISLQCTLNNVTITGNQLGSSTSWGANTIGVQVQAGACNHYNITGNITTGAGTGISDAGTGTDKTISNAANNFGTITNDNAAAGAIGEQVTSTVVVGSAVALTNNVAVNITSISLTAGDWDVTGEALYTGNAATNVTYFGLSLNTTTGTISQAPGQFIQCGGGTGATFFAQGFGIQGCTVGTMRFSLSATTTIFMVTQVGFTVNTASAYGLLRARRVR